MSKLDDLRASLLEMDSDELLTQLRQIRADRRVSKKAIRAAPKKTREEKKKGVKAILDALPPEERAALLKSLTEK